MKIFVTILLWLTQSVRAEPFKPVHDEMIVEHLPKSLLRWRAARLPASQPSNAAEACVKARALLQIAQQTSDPAFVRYASEVLAPWQAQTNNAPSDLLFLTAVIRQHQHDFEGALACLETLFRSNPRHAEAALLKASILTTQGRYIEAKAIFAANLRLTATLRGLTIFLTVTSLEGGLAKSEETLGRAVSTSGDPTERAFAWSALAEMAVRRGDILAAESRFQRSLQLEPGDSYILAAYCDLLLSSGRDREVFDLVAPDCGSEALLTRRLIAGRRWTPGLANQFAAQLKESGHWRELALLQLELAHPPDGAFATACENWKKQKEPIDAILVLRSAGADGKRMEREAVLPVLQWAKTNRIEDVRLKDLMSQWEGEWAAR